MSSSSALELAAPAKLNLCLEVLGRREDGYHEIDSVFQAIDLHDTVRLARGGTIRLEVAGEEAPGDATNLAWRAAEALGVGASIRLDKRIPPGAGLGGGSSDAAAVLVGLNHLYGLGLSAQALAQVARGLGADVPFFLTGGAARCRGIGDRVEPLPDPPERRFLVLIPPIPVSTREVYAALDAGLTGSPEIANLFVGKYYRREEPGRLPCFNRLQEAAEGLEPRLIDVRRAAEARFGATFGLTGSGSAYFAQVGGDVKAPGTLDAGGGLVARLYLARTRPRATSSVGQVGHHRGTHQAAAPA